MIQDQQSLQAQTLRENPSARALTGQDLDDSKAILNGLGHFLYRPTTSLGSGRSYVTSWGKKIICEGSGAATVCRWA